MPINIDALARLGWSQRRQQRLSGITAFEFRIANRHKNELVELEAKVLYSRTRERGGRRIREFLELGLERRTVVFFPLTWTVVHPIDETSPLKDVTLVQLEAEDAEFLVLLQGTDETFAQRVHARSSYKPHEIVWHARFTDVFQPPAPDGMLAVDVGRLHEFERLVAPGVLLVVTIRRDGWPGDA